MRTNIPVRDPDDAFMPDGQPTSQIPGSESNLILQKLNLSATFSEDLTLTPTSVITAPLSLTTALAFRPTDTSRVFTEEERLR